MWIFMREPLLLQEAMLVIRVLKGFASSSIPMIKMELMLAMQMG